MRRFTLVLVLAAFLAVLGAAPAGARAKPPAGSLGTYSYNDGGMGITVGYTCPGTLGFFGIDPDAQYWAIVGKGQSSMTIARHDQWKLDSTFSAAFGFHLSPKAMQVLGNDPL